MAHLTKANLVEALHQKGVSVPSGSPKKELLVKLYRQHILSDVRFSSGDFSSDEDVQDTSKGHNDSSTLPEVVSDNIKSLTNDALFDKLQKLGYEAGPIVDSTRSLYEKKLQQLLNNGSVHTSPREEFSATEEEEEESEVILEDNSDEEDGGTPLQKGPTTFFSPSPQTVRFNLSDNNHPGVNEIVQPSRRSFSYSTRSSVSQAASPVQMTLRSRAGTCGEDVAGSSGATKSAPPATGKQRHMSLAVKVLIVLAVITVNVLIYANLEYFKGSDSATPVPSVLQD
ncbi:unnamed protein product [Ixodes hexagonus]